MENSKKRLLTKEVLVKNKIKNKKIWELITIISLLCIVIFTIVFLKEKISDLIYLLVLIGVIIQVILCIRYLKTEIKYINNILNGNFKIIEDEVYDRHYIIFPDGSEEYVLFTKIYGLKSVKGKEYWDCKKDDRIFLLIGDKEKAIEYFWENKYELDESLKQNFVPYDEKIGKMKFNEKIQEKIIEQGKKIRCKNCNEKYKMKDYEECPKCNYKNKFEIKEIVNEKSWY